MDHTQQDLLAFFSQQPQALPLCEAFLQKLQAQHPETHTRVQKTQITFSNRHIFARLSFARVRKKRFCLPNRQSKQLDGSRMEIYLDAAP